MKTLPLLLLPIFSLILLTAPARAQEPVRTNLTPELRALLADLLKQQAEAAAEAESGPAPEPAPAPNPPAAAVPAARPPLGSASSLRAGRLSTGRLAGASLAPSGPVGGRGQTGAPRLSKEEWRVLFPVQQEGR